MGQIDPGEHLLAGGGDKMNAIGTGADVTNRAKDTEGGAEKISVEHPQYHRQPRGKRFAGPGGHAQRSDFFSSQIENDRAEMPPQTRDRQADTVGGKLERRLACNIGQSRLLPGFSFHR